MKLNYYGCRKATTATYQVELDEFLNWVKNPTTNPAHELIKRVRKSINKEVKSLIKEQLPCILFAYTTNEGRKTLKSITGTTGILFIDIDDSTFNPDLIKNVKYLIACYKSSSNNGYHLLLSVNNLSTDKEVFKQQVNEIAEFIGVKPYIDERAIKRTQIAYLTFDENAIINTNYSTYKFNTSVPTSKITKENSVYMNDMGTRQPIRFDDTDDIPFEEDEAYKVDFKEGFEITKAFLIPYKLTDNRYNTLLAYCNNLVYLNQDLTKEKVQEMLTNTAEIISENGYSQERIRKIVDTVFRYKEQGTLEPIKFNKRRKIIFSPQLKKELTKEEKLGIVINEIAKNKTNESKNKINNIINNWDLTLGKVSVRNISNNYTINKKTVAKYYNLFNKKVSLINTFVPTSKITRENRVYMNDMGTLNWKRTTSTEYLYQSKMKNTIPIKIRFMDNEKFLRMIS